MIIKVQTMPIRLTPTVSTPIFKGLGNSALWR